MSIFAELVGQDSAVVELQRAANAARDMRAGGENASAMSHAWLFTGPPGSGRSLAAKTLAGALLCSGPVAGCGECPECKAALADNHPDITLVTTELVTITADEVREYVSRSYVAPSSGKWRIFIIEDADRMQARTTNVLLKAIEEPGPRTVWMLCTAAAADVLPTIRSRCRNVNLVTPDSGVVADLLVNRDGVDPEVARVAAQAAQSHVGVARALATDPEAASIRKKTLDALVSVRGVGDAVMAAALFNDADAMKGKSGSAGKKSKKSSDDDDRARAEQERRMDALGLDSSARIPASVRSQLKDSTDAAKRRETRQQRDMLDREMIYMLSFFRDVLVSQVGSDVEFINADYAGHIQRIASETNVRQTLARMDAIAEARQRLKGNVAAQLVLESVLITLRP